MSANRAARRQRSRKNVNACPVSVDTPLSPHTRRFVRRFTLGTAVVIGVFIACLCAAISSPHDNNSATTQPLPVVSAINPDTMDPLARLAQLRQRFPAPQTDAAVAFAAMEGLSGSNLQLAGFGGEQADPNTAVSTFEYGADGLRHRMNVSQGGFTNTTDYAYDGQNLVRTFKNGGPGETFLPGIRGPVYRRDDVTGQVRWYLYDGTGNVAGEVDPQGNITSRRKLDVFGQVRGGSNAGGTSKHKFQGGAGHLSDDETGLTFMRARYFDPVTGRFISQDPMKHGINWFTYCRNNPLNLFDFSGKMDLGEEMEGMADGESMEAELSVDPAKLLEELRANSAPESLNGFTEHGASRFATRFEDIFGRPGSTQDGIDLLAKWNPGKAFIGSQGRWMCTIQMRGVLLYLVAEGDELHTFFQK